MVRTSTVVALSLGLASSACADITIPTVPIGYAGNASDPGNSLGSYGSVSYTYNLGTTEVTNAQYAAFLNAVGASDPNALYNTNMAGSFGGITRSGSPGSYTYATVSGRENNPVNFVNFWDAARFANWLHNGQPTGAQSNATTEDGAYTLTPTGITNNTVTRNANWNWAVASSNEWYKGAFFQPASAGGDSDNYWLFTTSSNATPTAAQANFLPSGFGNTVPVASYAPNFFGLYDMGGNVYEMTDSIASGPFRGPFWGGAFDNIAGWLTPANPIISFPTTEREQVGFRVVSIPAPGAVALLGLSGFVATRRRR